jgi:hypothetical protein
MRNRPYWYSVLVVLLALAVVAARIYHPGEIVEFSDTIYPLRPDLTMRHWMSWWSTGNMGFIWTNVCWFPNLLIPYIAWLLHVPSGAGQAVQYFSWLAVPLIAVAFCIDRVCRSQQPW